MTATSRPPRAKPKPRRSVRQRRLFLAVGAVAALLLLGYFGIGALIVQTVLVPVRQPVATHPGNSGLAYEDVTLRARDGTELAFWFIPKEASERVILMVHGKDSSRTSEYGGEFLDLARELHSEGYNVAMIDLRGHGASSGSYFTLGDRERWDVVAAVEWLDAKGFEKIGVLGVSLGGASAAEATTVTDKIDALLLDSVFPDVESLLAREFPSRANLPAWFLPSAVLMGRVLTGGDVGAVKPALHTGPEPTPLLIFYGTEDNLIPDEEFQLFQRANPDATTWVAEGPGHAELYLREHDEFIRRTLTFFGNTLR